MLETFISRTPFSYNIPSLDKLLQTKEIPSSFLAYDEQVLNILISAGINASDAYVCLKGIKKKKYDKVEAYKDQFKNGFEKHLIEDEKATPEEASRTVDNIWGIIESSASYLFNASHSLCVACDSLYVAWLKAYYPYELYTTMLKIWDEKKNTDKISAIIAEMKRYKNISLTAGRFGQDNRDWLVDKEKGTISQSLSSIKHISKKAAQDLYRVGQMRRIEHIPDENDIDAILEGREPRTIEKECPAFETFTDLLRELQMNTCLDTRQISILIELNYFEQFGSSGKLMKVFTEFFEGKNKLTKTVKSYDARLKACRAFENSLPNEGLPLKQRLAAELSNIGLCLTVDSNAPADMYFVREVDNKYGVKAMLYSVQRGTAGIIRFRKEEYGKASFSAGDCIRLIEFNKSPRYVYKDGGKTVVPGEFDIWARKYKVI